MTKKLLLAFGLLFILTPTNIFACDCDYGGDFLEVAPQTKMVALIRVIKFLTFEKMNDGINEETKMPLTMEVEIIEVYQGAETRKTITVWGDNGMLCRPYLSLFKEGSLYVIAFQGANNEAGENEKDYSISSCGQFWLTITGKGQKRFAEGNVGQKLKQISLSDLKQKLKK